MDRISSAPPAPASDPDPENGADDNGDSDDAGMDVAAAMGFASFGAQSRPSKKRRLDRASLDGDAASGANGVAVRRPRMVLPPPVMQAPDAGPRYVDDDDDLEEGFDAAARGEGLAAAAAGADGGPRGPVMPKPVHSARGHHATLPPRPPPPASQHPPPPRLPTDSALHPQPGVHGAPLPPSLEGHGAVGASDYGLGDEASSRQFRQHHHAHAGRHPRGSKKDDWSADYYDPSFNANPWWRLERDMGLEPRGSFLPPAQHHHH